MHGLKARPYQRVTNLSHRFPGSHDVKAAIICGDNVISACLERHIHDHLLVGTRRKLDQTSS